MYFRLTVVSGAALTKCLTTVLFKLTFFILNGIDHRFFLKVINAARPAVTVPMTPTMRPLVKCFISNPPMQLDTFIMRYLGSEF